MIQFFRRIRQKLLAQGRLSKYLVYALGEIALVMIGILLALQVNNWNQERKNKNTERQLYENLLTNLEGDSTDINIVLESVDIGINAQKTLIETSYEDLIDTYTVDEIKIIIRQTTAVGRSFFPRYSAYEQIANNGFLPLLQSEEIKNKLSELYERSYKRYEQVDAGVEQKNQFILRPIINGDLKLMYPGMDVDPAEGFDLQKLKTHFDELTKQCRSTYALSVHSKRLLNGQQKSVSELLQLIREEMRN